MNLENTYLKHVVINSDEYVIDLIRNIYNGIYDDAVAIYTDTDTPEKRRKVRKLVSDNQITTYSNWKRELLQCLVNFLNAYFAPTSPAAAFGYDPITTEVDKYFLQCMETVLPYEEDALRYDPVVVEEAVENNLPVPDFAIKGTKQIDVDAIDDLIDFFEKLDGAQRQALGRPSHHELITFVIDKGTGWIIMNYWGDNRIHLYNEMIRSEHQ